MAHRTPTTVAGHIAVIDGQPTTTTLDIADVYGKQHAKVLAIVRQRMAEVPAEWRLANFGEASIERPQTNGGTVSYPVIRMTKKGFHFVVGKFTGAKAVAHQIAFADEFERMEAELRNPAAALLGPAPQAMDVHTLCQLILGGIFTGQDFLHLAYAVNQHQYMQAARNSHQGYGEEVASKISELSWSDLHTINQRASMEVWLRTAQQQVKATS